MGDSPFSGGVGRAAAGRRAPTRSVPTELAVPALESVHLTRVEVYTLYEVLGHRRELAVETKESLHVRRRELSVIFTKGS